MGISEIAQAFITLITNAPAIINETIAAYNAIKSDLSETDQTAIDQALATAQSQDAQATATADTALDAAAQH